MSRIWRAELLRALMIWCLGALLGWLLGYPLLGVFAATLILLGNCWVRLRGIELWLADNRQPAPTITYGVWGSVLSGLNRWQRQAKKRKKRVRRAVSRFRAAIEASPDGAVILGKNDEVLWLNGPATTMLSLQTPQDVHRPVTQIVRAPGFAEYLDAGQFDDPMEMESPAEADRRLMLRVVPYDRDRRLLLVRDVTRLYRLEQTRKRFVANVSHELRSPLTVVLGYLESMSDDPSLSEHWQRPLQLMSQQAERMRLIVEDLLRLSQMESDPGGAETVPIRVGDLLQIVKRDASGLGRSTHDIQIDCDDGLLLLGQYNELYSAFSNLVFNALQYTPEGGRIVLQWYRDAQEARLNVIDSGVGIEPHHLPRLTERFYRVDKVRSRELGGTGLGLAIVKHVLARHDARLSIQSLPGEGSTFSCVFPDERVRYEEQSDLSGDGDRKDSAEDTQSGRVDDDTAEDDTAKLDESAAGAPASGDASSLTRDHSASPSEREADAELPVPSPDGQPPRHGSKPSADGESAA